MIFSCFYSLYFHSIYSIISLLLLALDLLFYLNFENYIIDLRCLSFFIIDYTFIAMDFPVSISLSAFLRLWNVVFFFSFTWKYFLIFFVIYFLTDWLFRKVFNFPVFVNFPISFFYWFIISLFCEIMTRVYTCMISFISNLLVYILWSNMQYILENVPCTLEKNVHLAECFIDVC